MVNDEKKVRTNKIVFALYASISLLAVFLSPTVIHPPIYFPLYCVLSTLILYVFTVIIDTLSATFAGLLSATAFLALIVIYGMTNGSIGILQDGFLVSICICSLFLNTYVNLYALFSTVLIYVFYAIFFSEELVSHFIVPGELVIKMATMLLGEIGITVLVVVIKRSQNVLVEKNKSYMELLRIVEFKKKDAVTAAKAKTDFLANMSHEIRTPMNAIVGMTEIILRDDISPDVRENAHNIKSAGNALLAIINDILDFSKIESGKMEITEVKYQITSVINDVINIISVRLLDKRLDLIVDAEPFIPSELYGDEIRLRQILTNLLNNAAKFTSEGYILLKMSFETRGGKPGLCVSVSDTGSGIRDADKNKLFESFRRLDTRQNRSVEGTGLGLSICKRLLDLMDGSISVESEFGRGSTFSFFLPQSVSNEAPIAEVGAGADKMVLYADESALHLEYAEKNFKYLNVRAVFARSTDELLSLGGESYSFIFITQSLYDANIQLVKKFAAENGMARIVLTVEKNMAASDRGDALVLHRPVYCSALAAVLNNEPLRTVYGEKEFRESFTVPDAEVLVVDDNAVNLKVIKGLLKPYKLRLSTAMSGRECLEMLAHKHYDLIYMDHMMPGLDGIDTLKLIREMDGEYYRTVPVIALTANAISGFREMFFSVGFQDYVSKPIELLQLEKSLRNHLPPERIVRTDEQAQSADGDVVLIDGVDTERGVFNCGGILSNYIEVLNVVYADAARLADSLTKYAECGDYKSYIIQAHAMKSVCANIGAASLSELAKAHEFAGYEKNYDYISNGFRQLSDEFRKLAERIRCELIRRGELETEEISETSSERISAEELTKAVSETVALIDAFEQDRAVELLNGLLSVGLDDADRDVLRNARRMVSDYQFDEATAALNKLIFGQRQKAIP